MSATPQQRSQSPRLRFAPETARARVAAVLVLLALAAIAAFALYAQPPQRRTASPQAVPTKTIPRGEGEGGQGGGD